MRKMNKLPREENDKLPVEGEGVSHKASDDDVQAHRAGAAPDEVGTRLPGTGGDYRRPTSGGELTEDDVEGHHKK